MAVLCALLEYGGDLRLQTLNNETPRDVAVRKRHMAIVSVIEDACEFNMKKCNLFDLCV